SQYRSVIFYHSEEQKSIAIKYKDRLDLEGVWENPIVTEISSVPEFFPAEDYHKDYLENNSSNAYCQAVVRPKVDKFKRVFSKSLK
ncbi:MAG TPA: peptide-methionine (S)-S-oxide reductase, partial [Crocinitomicaceae bacterium]|nr:peptide-methionine (S)-S-oxide reductase [Crocinitomicaceae bacterium]